MTTMEVVDLALRVTATVITLVSATVALFTFANKVRDDRRKAVWERMQWAIDHAWSDDPKKSMIGWIMLDAVVQDGIADGRDRTVAETALRFLDRDDEFADTLEWDVNSKEVDDNDGD